MKILLLEDDMLLAELIKEHLREKGYEAITFTNGEDAYEYLYENSVDLLLLDINVPGIKGSKLLKNLREQHNRTPAIFITSLNASKDVKIGFALGCDDYIKKPFEFDELDARIEHVLKIYNLHQEVFLIDEYEFFPDKNLLRYKDATIHLPAKASKILHYFLTHPNRLVTKEELIANIWEDIPTEATIRTYIKMLRDHFKDKIQTIRGIGYEFTLS